MPGDEKGFVQVYTGNGKGKTTAAMGLALRAAGNGMNTFIGQFVKEMKYGEVKSLEKLSGFIKIKQYGRGCFIRKNPCMEDVEFAKRGLEELKEIIISDKYDIVILDEINIALHYDLLKVKDILELIEIKPERLELVFTGRKADQRIIDKADLVTEMREIKHYYQQGVLSRKGIER